MRYLKAFIAGMILPAVIAPFLISYFAYQGELLAIQKFPFLYFGPILWGLWNILFVSTRRKVPIMNRNHKIGLYGAAYGLVSALINSLYFEFTSVVPALSDSFILLAIVGYPILLYVAWKYVVNVLNLIFEVY